MTQPCEVVLITQHEETRRRIIAAGGVSKAVNSVREWPDGEQSPSVSLGDQIFSIVAALIISGLIICGGYWAWRL